MMKRMLLLLVLASVLSAEASRTERFLAEAERTAREECRLPESFWKWLDSKPDIRTGLLASHDPVHPGAVKNLYFLAGAMGRRKAERYTHLLLATAIARKETNLQTGEPWVDAPVPESKKKQPDPAAIERAVGVLVKYKKSKGMTLVDMVKNEDAILKETGIGISRKQMGGVWTQVGIESGTFPERKMPTAVDFLNALIARYETKLPGFNDKGPDWPLFPIDKAPWPLLMPLGETRPLDECQYVWDHYTGKQLYPEGKKKKCRRIKTYGKYTWDYKLPERKYKESNWHPGAMPRIVEDGGVCGRQSQLARTTYIALGKPAIQMGQPGHSALITFEALPDGTYQARRGQSIAPMNKSFPNWPLNDADGVRSYRNGTRTGAEYHLGLAMAMNLGLDAYMQSRIAYHLAKRGGPERQGQRRALLEEAVKICPYNIQAWYAMAEDAGTDIPRINQIIQNVYKLMGDPEATLEFDAERSATTDFNDVAEKKPSADKNAGMVALVVGMSMVEHAYPKALKDNAYVREGYAFLQQEMTRQAKMKKSPYVPSLSGLIGDFEIAINGLASVKRRTTEYVMSEIGRTKKKGKLNSTRIAAQLDAVLKAMDNGDEKVTWLQGFRDELEKVHGTQRLFKYSAKKDKVSVDKTYDYLVKAQAKAIRGKGRKFRGEAAKLQQAHKDRIEQLRQQYKKQA